MFSLIYTTFPDEETAKALLTPLLKNNLIACANIFTSARSLYMWEGQMAEESECIAILKTRKEHFSKLEDYFKTHHPYDCPALIELSSTNINQPFLDWVNQETSL